MIKHLKFYMLNRIVKDPILTAQIYNMIYHKGTPPKKEVTISPVPVTTPISFSPEVQIPTPEKKFVPKSEVDELKSQLQYLRNKTFKTKQDKESMGILEAVLKNKGE